MNHKTCRRGSLLCLRVFALAGALTCAQAWAINKCTGADGKVVFQDAPCAGRGEVLNVRPASGHANMARPADVGAPQAAQPATPAAKKEGAFGESWQRRTYLENRGIPDAQAASYRHKQDCEKKLADLRAQQSSANNNLAGATFLQSLAAEMQATATMCDVRSRELNAELDAMKKELRELQAK
ncbi:DUF4124 domain-containing protein [Alicycliphilus denitrificans]|uniref:DUF4124 domain-containing protein n=1 Tax=Alicycliphilus denitrificans TaxID=179636 RepID=UPI0001DA0DE9|nr:DUF4124 domain-containing protein [Alicycliphilus denitrificans]